MALYTPDELKILNNTRAGYGLAPMDADGNEIVTKRSASPKAPKAWSEPVAKSEVVTDLIEPVSTAVETVPIPELVEPVQELEQFGESVSEKEIKARRKLEEAFRLLVKKKTYELARASGDSLVPTDMESIMSQAANDAMNDVDGLDAIVGGFMLEGYSKDDIPILMPKMLAQVFGIEPVASPVDLPPVAGEGEPDLGTALAPQSRVGETSAQWEADQGRIGIIVPEKYAEQEGIDIADMSASNSEARRQVAQYAAFYEVYEYQRGVYPEQDIEAAITEVSEDINKMYAILSGQGTDADYREHNVGQDAETSAWAAPWFKQVPSGKVPILNGLQERYLRSITEKVKTQSLEEDAQEKAHIAESGREELWIVPKDPTMGPMLYSQYAALRDTMPYEAQSYYDNADSEWRAVEPVEGAADRPEDYMLREGVTSLGDSQYQKFIQEKGLEDHWSLDFWDDPENYAEGGIWNKSYPSGAMVEGPTKYFLRILMAPISMSSRMITTLGTTPGRGEDGYVTKAELASQEAEAPLYKGHPYLRNIAEFRGIGDDLADIAEYTPGLEGYAGAAFGYGLLTDILFTPYDPGFTQAIKGMKAGALASKTAGILGAPARLRVKSFGKDFIKSVQKSYYDQTVMSLIKPSASLSDPIAMAASRTADWLADEAAFTRAYNKIIGDTSGGSTLYADPTKAFQEALEVSAKARGNAKSLFRDSAMIWGQRKTLSNIGNISKPTLVKNAPLQASKYFNYMDDVEKFANGKISVLPHKTETQGLIDMLKGRNPEVDNLIKGLSVDKAIKMIYADGRFIDQLLAPLHHSMGQHLAVAVVEGSKFKGGISNLIMVTKKLFLEPVEASKLAKSLKTDEVVETLVNIAKVSATEGRIKTGLYPFFQTLKGKVGKKSFRPRMGSYIDLSLTDAIKISKLVKELKAGGFINAEEAARIYAGLNASSFAKKFGILREVENIDRFFDITKKYLSMENIKVITNAAIERHAFARGIGVRTKALEGASTATKRQIALTLDARHLRGNWVARKWNNWWGKAKGWDKAEMDGAPLSAIIRASEYRGQLSNLGQLTKKELDDILRNPDVTKMYFEESFLAGRKLTLNDAIVAGMLGPIVGRSSTAMHKTLDTMMNIIIYGEAQVSPMAIFSKGSLRRQKLADELNGEGKRALQELLYGKDGLGGYIDAFRKVQGHRQYVYEMNGFYDEFIEITLKPSNYKDPTFVRKAVSLDELPDLTAGTYFANKANRLAEEAVDDIVGGWDALQNITNNTKLADNMAELFRDGGSVIKPIVKKQLVDEIENLKEIIDALENGRTPAGGGGFLGFDKRPDSGDMAWLVSKMADYPHWDTFVPGGIQRFRQPPGHPQHMDIPEWKHYDTDLRKIQAKVEAKIKDNLSKLEDTLDGVLRDDVIFNRLLTPQSGAEATGYIAQAIANRVKEIVKHRANGNAISPIGSAAKYEDWSVIVQNILGIQPRYAKTIIKQLADPKNTNPSIQKLRELIMKTKEEVDTVAVEILLQNRLNYGNAEETLAVVDWIVEDIDRLGRTIREGVEVGSDDVERLAGDAFINMLTSKLMGKGVTETMGEIKNTSEMTQNVRKAMSHLYDTKPVVAAEVLGFLDKTLKFMTATRYTLILASRAAFHSINVATAQAIVWGTLGGRSAVAGLSPSTLVTAGRVHSVGWTRAPNAAAFLADEGVDSIKVLGPSESVIAVTDKFGRSYTYREVWDMAVGSGALRSQTAIIINSKSFGKILQDARFTPEYRGPVTAMWRGLKGRTPEIIGAGVGAMAGGPAGAALGGIAGGIVGKHLPARLARKTTDNTVGNFLMNMTEWEDQYFRLGQVIHGLKTGEEPFTAVGRGKLALMDYGSLSREEQWASSRLFMFYAFAKLNAVNTLSLMLHNPKRLSNLYQAKRITEITGGPDTSGVGNFYAHHFLLSRPMVSYIEGSDKTSHYTVMPPVPALDGLSMLAQMYMAPNLTAMMAPITDLANPELKMLRGTPARLEWKKKYVDPTDIQQMFESGLYEYFWDTVVKERPHRKQAVAGDQTYQGSTWWLSEEGMKRYYYWKNHLAPFLTFPSIIGGDTNVLMNMVTPGGVEGKRYGKPDDSIGEKMLRAGALKADVGTLPVSAQQQSVLREVTKRLEELEEK